jgi:hypothetical protein
MRAAYQPQLKAAVCAACHQDKNDPDEDGDFEESNGIISEPTYLEWANSPYADPKSTVYATCVDCHMKPTNADQACSIQSPSLKRPPGDVRSHTFPGTTPEFLENAISLSMTATKNNASLDVKVIINNDKTGHHVPTGVTIRNMILLVEAWRDSDKLPLTDSGTERIHELGGVGDVAKGYFAGLPGKLYAKINADSSGKGPTFFTDAVSILSDNRIPPLGSDETNYKFAVPQEGGKIHVQARVVYRRTWRALADAKGWANDGHGKALEDLEAPNFGHLMAKAEQVVEWPSTVTPTAGSSGMNNSAGTSGASGTAGSNTSAENSVPPAADDSGCSCRTATPKPDNLWAMFGSAAIALSLMWHRRHRSCRKRALSVRI